MASFERTWVTPAFPFVGIQLGADGFSSPVASKVCFPDLLPLPPADLNKTARFVYRRDAEACRVQTLEVGRERQGKGHASPFSVLVVLQPSPSLPEKAASFLSARLWAINRSDKTFTTQVR